MFKTLLRTALAWMCLSVPVLACDLVTGVAIDTSGNIIPGASGTVTLSANGLVVILYDGPACSSTLDNPITSDASGNFSFFVEDSIVTVTFAKDGYVFNPITNLKVFEPLGRNVRTLGYYPTTDLASAQGAISQIGATTMTLIINVPATSSANVTCPNNITLLFLGQGILTISNGTVFTANCRIVNLTGGAVLLGSGTYTVSSSSFIERAQTFPAILLTSDGTQCANSARATLNSGPAIHTIICADNDGSSIYGFHKMPLNWNAGTITFTLIYVQTAADTAVMNSDITAQCRGAAEVVSSTWGTEVAIDDAAVTGSSGVDQTTSAAVTPAGTCNPGDVLWFRWQLDASGTTTAVATLHILGIEMKYLIDPDVPMAQ